MPTELALRLPHGTQAGGTWHRDAVLRAPDPWTCSGLADDGDLPAAAWTTRVLEACLHRVGDRRVDPRDLTAGDREALLLGLHRLVAGDPLPLLVDCPRCGETLSVEADASALLAPPAHEQRPWHETTLDGVCVRFRLPTGADLEAAGRAGDDPDAAVRALMDRIVLEQDGTAEPDELARHVSPLVAELDPQSELRLDLTCPDCGGSIDAHVDLPSHLLADLRRHGERLEWEVHRLALHYHWSEEAILALPPERRGRYLERIEAEVGP